MPPEVGEFLFGTATPYALGLSAIALIVTSFARGWIVPRFIVEELLRTERTRSDDYKAANATLLSAFDVLKELPGEVKKIGETQERLLNALPIAPRSGGKSERVDL